MKKIQVSINDEMISKLEDYSNFYGVSVSALVNFLIHDSIDELELDKLRERTDYASIGQIVDMFKLQGHRRSGNA